jgi:hypothetical protein
LRRFYSKGFEETDTHRRWAGLWQKQFKARLHDETFISLNKLRPRFSFQSLRRYSVSFAPLNLYVSALNWLMPERVSEKGKANRTYPIGGEYVVDVDHYLNYLPHSHHTSEEGVCEGCAPGRCFIQILIDLFRLHGQPAALDYASVPYELAVATLLVSAGPFKRREL